MPAHLSPDQTHPPSPEALVGRRLRELRVQRGFSLRALAEQSGLNINTLSLIENGKSSPSVSTLQLLAQALDVPIATFFEVELQKQQVVFTPASQQIPTAADTIQMMNLGENLVGNAVQAFRVQLPPGGGSGERLIVHTGHEFVYCLAGTIHYLIDQNEYLLHAGDSLVFQSHLPHRWNNSGVEPVEFLLVLYPSDANDQPGKRHLILQERNRGTTMKIAAITDDGKTISQHFGRAQNYLVLTVENGQIIGRELRPKLGHNQFSGAHHSEEHGSGQHGSDPAAHNKHVSMAQAIADCSVLLCGGMGMGAYQSMLALNIEPLVTDIRDIEQAAQAYLAGQIVNRTDLLH